MKNVFIVGCKGIPAKYGGYETFVDELVSRQKNKNIKYHVACMNQEKEEMIYNGARCFNVKVPNIGPAKAVYYDIYALKQIISYIKKNNLKDGIVYVLACRIGPFFNNYVNKLHKLGFKVYVNPDGHEWKRAKWNKAIRQYWKISERLMVKHADLLICDSINIENYIKEDYKQYNPNTTFIAYGADITKSSLTDDSKELNDWYNKFNIKNNEYYLIVGRFVPENNYETIIKEFMKSNSQKDLVIITNVEQNKFYNSLKETTNFEKDKRIKFVGTVYNKNLIKKIRENAYGYFHGHEVGGTNPSLLEALASTKLNLLLDVGFNKEVAEDGALYWNKENYNLAKLIDYADNLAKSEISEMSKKAKNRIETKYSWNYIIAEYERVLGE
jgi:rhamnosyltransferase